MILNLIRLQFTPKENTHEDVFTLNSFYNFQ